MECLNCLFFPGSVLEGFVFLEIYPFILGCPFCWHIIASNILSGSVFLLCISPLSFHILFIWFLSLLFLMWDWLTAYSPPHPKTNYWLTLLFLKKFLLIISTWSYYPLFLPYTNWALFLLLFLILYGSWASLVVLVVKNLPAMHETQVWSWSQEDTLRSNDYPLQYFLRIPWIEELRPQFMGCKEFDKTEWQTLAYFLSHFSCLFGIFLIFYISV